MASNLEGTPCLPGVAANICFSTCLEVFPMLIDNVIVTIENGPFTAEDAQFYISQIKKAKPKYTLRKISFSRNDDSLDIRYSFQGVPFERIRRISPVEEGMRCAVNH